MPDVADEQIGGDQAAAEEHGDDKDDVEEASSTEIRPGHDGASEMAYFFKILLPVCTPIIATISMWNFVGMWNKVCCFQITRCLPLHRTGHNAAVKILLEEGIHNWCPARSACGT